ncbi:MAG: flavodoxin family protein [Thermoplasmatota archaeon]
MAKTLVCYFSKSGTTEKMAKEIIKGIKESDSDVIGELRKVSETDVQDLKEYDCLILGSPTYYGLPSAEIKKFIDESIVHHGKLEWMVGGAFTSSANPAGGNETALMAILESLLIHGMVIKGMSKGDHYGPVVIGEPDERELKQCRFYGKWMADLTNRVSKWNLKK